MNQRPRLSVIVPVYGTEAYVRECLESVAAQDVDLEIIVVNDGSPDKSQEVIDRFARFDPRVRVIVQENLGPGAARNRGLEIARGDYVAFVDSDDRLPPGAYRCLLDAATLTTADICVGLNQSFRGERTWLNSQMTELLDCVTSSARIGDFPALARDASPCNKIIERRLIERGNFRFPDRIRLREDLHFVIRAYAAADRITVLPSVVYQYRLRSGDAPTSLTMTATPKMIRDLFWVADDLAGLLRERVSREVRREFDRGILGNIAFRLADVLGGDTASLEPLCTDLRRFTGERRDALNAGLPGDNRSFGELLLLLLHEGRSELAIELASGRPASLVAACAAAGASDPVLEVATALDAAACPPPATLERRADRALSRFMSQSGGKPSKYRAIARRTLNLSLARTRLARGTGSFGDQEIWLVGERRGLSVEDTGYHFFRYLRTEHPDLPAYFVSREDAKGFDRLAALGNVLIHGSPEAYEAALAARVIAYSDCRLDVIADRPSARRHLRPDLIGCFLQHGVIGLQRMGDFYHREAMIARGEHVDLFVASSELEKRFICDALGFAPRDVIATGLSRHDALFAADPPGPARPMRILVAPTWRQWLRYEDTETVARSRYFAAWQTLITDRQLLAILNDYDATLALSPHFAMAPHAGLFRSSSDRVVVLDPSKTTLQHEILRADCTITDYSSVSFESSYLGRPVIFYHFDAKRFAASRGAMLFSGEDALPGPVASTPSAVLSELAGVLHSACALKEPYATRAASLFAARDGKHSERIYKAIRARLNG